MPDVNIHPVGSSEHAADVAALAARGTPVPAGHSPAYYAAAGRSTDVWCRLTDTAGHLVAGTAVRVDRSRKAPWMRLLRARHAGGFISALGQDGVPNWLDALRRHVPNPVRLSVQVYDLDEAARRSSTGALGAAGFAPEAMMRDYDRTLVLPLPDSEEELMAFISGSARRGIRQAEKAGFQVTQLTDASFAPRMLALHQLAHARTGGPGNALDFEALIALGATDPSSARVVGVLHPERSGPEQLVGFLVGLRGPANIAFYDVGGSDRAPDIRAITLGYPMMWSMLCWCMSVGVTAFDFGGVTPADQPDHPLAGISDFKRKFRGTEQTVSEDHAISIAPVQLRLLDFASRVFGRVRA